MACPTQAQAVMASLSTQPELVLRVDESDADGFGIATALRQFKTKQTLSDADKNKKSIIDLIVSSQNAALLGHLENIYKLADMDKFIAAATNITGYLEHVNLDDLGKVFQ